MTSILKLSMLEFGLLLIFLSIFETGAFRRYYFGRAPNGGVGSPSAKPIKTKIHIKDHWIQQKLDNYNATNTQTWYNRYFARDAYYREGGPVFLMLRGEDRLSAGFMIKGAWINYAKQFGAMVFQLEHRFYGDSYPTNDITTDSLSYLSTEQALADAQNFIVNMTAKYGFKPYQKWLLFGGSYAGALSIWLANNAPNLIYGVISSSGPVMLKVNFTEYMKSVTETLQAHSPQCVEQITLAFQGVREKLQTLEGQYSLYNQFMLCDSAVNASTLDKSNLLYTLAGDLMNVVQYNLDNTINNFLSINETCNMMLNTTIPLPIDRLAAFNNKLLENQRDICVDYKYDTVIEQMRNASLWSDVAEDGDRQWVYQTCSQLGFFQTSDSTVVIFGNEFPVNFFIKQCMDIFGSNFNHTLIATNVKLTNNAYGGYQPIVNNVLSVQGSADPWHTQGITNNNTLGVTALVINGTSHCADMYEPRPTDSPALTQARTVILNYLTNLINDIPGSSLVSSSSSSSETEPTSAATTTATATATAAT